jgi:hypothetical protein
MAAGEWAVTWISVVGVLDGVEVGPSGVVAGGLDRSTRPVGAVRSRGTGIKVGPATSSWSDNDATPSP